MTTVDLSQTQWRALLALVQQGDEILLVLGDTPLARVLPLPAPLDHPRTPDLFPNAVWTSNDFDESIGI